ncbi:MAG: selenide, water dikinase SelD [Fidelibacterota bacterium]|nr:selenide, water dikinase SelD [Candidatus Neomarinimicrobiota bacterium]MDB9884168.1 selenide, water dikinase SelD [Candidatus Neomarinimicrobiota bacterium]
MGPKDLAQVLGKLDSLENDNVIVGFNGSDDAAVVRLNNGKLIVQTVDFFTPIVDSPYEFGQIAAANSLSDIYAMGAIPSFALNIVGFPIKKLSNEILSEILKGGADKAKEAGVSIIGGHSIDDEEPKYGLVVTGEVEESKLIRNSTAHENDAIILTKPLGTGIISTAIKQDKASSSMIAQAINSMKYLNAFSSSIMNEFDTHAATDISGFGLLGHLYEMCKGSNLSAKITFNKIPFLEGVNTLANDGFIPSGTKRNFEYISNFVSFSSELTTIQKMMTADAQTSGGLLLALPQKEANNYIKRFNEETGQIAQQIGIFKSKSDYFINLE